MTTKTHYATDGYRFLKDGQTVQVWSQGRMLDTFALGTRTVKAAGIAWVADKPMITNF